MKYGLTVHTLLSYPLLLAPLCMVLCPNKSGELSRETPRPRREGTIMELIDIEKWCEACYTEPAEKLLIASGRVILGWYCDPCGEIVEERTMERVEEHTTRRNQYRARCHFNENGNRQCLLDDETRNLLGGGYNERNTSCQ